MAWPTDVTPQLISSTLNVALRNKLVASNFTTSRFSGELATKGDRVTIPQLTDLSSSAYSGSISYASAASTSRVLTMDQDQYTAVDVDTNDSHMAGALDIVAAYADSAGNALAQSIDSYILSLFAGSGQTDISVTLASSDAYDDMVVVANENLNISGVGADRFLVVSPKGLSFLLKSSDFTRASAMSDEVMGAGAFKGLLGGFKVFVSNNLTEASSGVFAYGYGGIGEIAYGLSESTTNIIERQDSFSVGIRSRAVYGATLLHTMGVGRILATE